MDKFFLNSLDRKSFDSMTVRDIPFQKLLEGSLYYPSSGNDGGPVKYLNTRYADLDINSYVYCDYYFGQHEFLSNLNTFRGYHLVGQVSESYASAAEMMAGFRDYALTVPPGVTEDSYRRYEDEWHPFIGWAVLERDADKGDDWGQERFSLLYIGGEGVATYEMLYWRYGIVPKALCFVQDGAAFGFNWTSYRRDGSPMQWVVRNHPSGDEPEYVLFGGTILTPFEWTEYVVDDLIRNYYGSSGTAVLMKKQ